MRRTQGIYLRMRIEVLSLFLPLHKSGGALHSSDAKHVSPLSSECKGARNLDCNLVNFAQTAGSDCSEILPLY